MPRFIPCGSATPVDDFKESRMQLDNATNLDRKSGVPGTMKTGEAPRLLLSSRSKCGCALLRRSRLRDGSGIEQSKLIMQTPMVGPCLFAAARHGKNQVEDLLANLLNCCLSGGDAAGIDIDQV
jgi:hypothetical protein